MYVRSQDKKKIVKIQVINYEKVSAFHYLKANGIVVGEYRTEEEAIKQIDNITNLLWNKARTTDMYEIS